jgi:hypothetical protein
MRIPCRRRGCCRRRCCRRRPPRRSGAPKIVRVLDEDAFVKRLPRGLAPIQALQIEVLVYCADVVETSYGAIRSIALSLGEAIMEPANRLARQQMFIHAWTIVDSVHVARDMLQDLGYPKAADFRDKYQVAAALRNKMDHVSDQAQNLVTWKNAPPLFGMLSYRHIRVEEIDGEFRPAGGGVIGVSHGVIRKRSNIGDLVNPAGLPAPAVDPGEIAQFGRVADNFQLSAFKLTLPLEAAAHDLSALMDGLNDFLSRSLPAQLEKHAKEEGLQLDDVMQPHASNFSTYVNFAEYEGESPAQ